ncbi:MAG: hypothetical protein VR70_12320 [Rhodospirillaceae bacterium BRH_c57]|nr:MAG: hypothetical protein VR70_12320 [Rhodospirillaceae bacterium BRH_c57]
MTTFQAQAERLEAEIASLDAVLAKEILRSGQRVNQLTEVAYSMSMDDAMDLWDEKEKEYAPLFGERGVYPEIPREWYGVIWRFCDRLKMRLSEDEYASLRIDRLKEKFGLTLDGHSHPGYVDDRITDEQSKHAEAVFEELSEAASREADHIKNLMESLKK